MVVYSNVTTAENLPYCQESICEKIFHNKKLGTATLVVWQGKEEIVHSYTFNLDRTALLTSKHSGNAHNNTIYVKSDSGAPPAPCPSGACSSPVSRTYETATEIITVTITYIYYNGQLVDVKVSESRRAKPSQNEQIK